MTTLTIFDHLRLPCDKWSNYFAVYDRHLSRFIGQAPVVVEVGVQGGGSLELWAQFFGPGAVIHGVDVDPECMSVEHRLHGVTVHIGDQASRAFWRDFRQRVPHIDVFIDDGGHTANQQTVTLDEMLPHIATNGVYLCEDLHTSYRASHDGGFLQTGTMIERVKRLADELHGRHSGQETFVTRHVAAMHLYESLLVIERGDISIERLRRK